MRLWQSVLPMTCQSTPQPITGPLLALGPGAPALPSPMVNAALVVMLGARIDVIQPQIRNLIAYLLPLPDKKTTTDVVLN